MIVDKPGWLENQQPMLPGDSLPRLRHQLQSMHAATVGQIGGLERPLVGGLGGPHVLVEFTELLGSRCPNRNGGHGHDENQPEFGPSAASQLVLREDHVEAHPEDSSPPPAGA